MNPTIRINLKSLKEISWPVVVLFLIQFYGLVTPKQAFIIYVVLIIVLIGFMKKIILPQIMGVRFYLFMILYSSVIGLILYNERNVARDLYYVVPAVALIILGYYLRVSQGERFSIFKTSVLCGTLVSLKSFINCIKNPSILASFEDMRGNFDIGVYHTLCAFIILFAVLFTDTKEKLFKKWINCLFFLLMFGQLLLSLSRSAWIGALVGCVVSLLLDIYVHGNIIKFVKKFTVMFCVIIIGGILFLNIAPDSITDEFADKFGKTTEELNSKQEFTSTGETMNNWRGYENQCAKKQWQQSTVWEEVFGSGMGKGIELEYVPYTWRDMVEDNEIPLLHNGYYTILIKGGVVGLMALIWFMLANVVGGFKLLKKRTDIEFGLIILISFGVIYLTLTYVVRGPVTQNINIIWTIFIGWIGADISKGNKTVEKIADESIGGE